jgi:hypothetical protein
MEENFLATKSYKAFTLLDDLAKSAVNPLIVWKNNLHSLIFERLFFRTKFKTWM